MITKAEIRDAISKLGIAGAEICVHASMRSFGERIEGNASGIVHSFLDSGCTVLVPAFTYDFLARPEKRYMPDNNGAGDYSYFLNRVYGEEKIFHTSCKDISKEDMGIFAECVLCEPKSVRGYNPLNSFAALGEHAGRLVENQTATDVYAPLGQLYDDDGFVLLMGVSLESATIIHYAEQKAGRRPFVRWAYDENGNVIPVFTGSCSMGFGKLEPILENYAKRARVGKSIWTCFRARELADVCAAAINKNPEITHCGNPDCERCRDAVAGGPVFFSG